ncbi:MAG: CpsD/CapB family tyrosine-protein kinase, partial [Pirellulaceae bacterium]|nr:CpsD/CapB family tyrosine-protein kinase [Pirellulaceae bacterium]
SLTVGLVLAWDVQGKRLNASQELIAQPYIRLLGNVPAVHGFLGSGSNKRGLFTDAVDSLRATIRGSSFETPPKSIMISSAVGQEGKSTLASQLAVSFAQCGQKTLLIDADLRNPQQHGGFGLSNETGLCEIMRGEVKIDSALQPTSVESLSLLSAGKLDQTAAQALGRNVLKTILSELDDQFDVIILDSGPVLTHADTLLIGQLADMTVLSTRRDVSRLPKIMAAVERLQSVGIPIAGAVLHGEATDSRKHRVPLFA